MGLDLTAPRAPRVGGLVDIHGAAADTQLGELLAREGPPLFPADLQPGLEGLALDRRMHPSCPLGQQPGDHRLDDRRHSTLGHQAHHVLSSSPRLGVVVLGLSLDDPAETLRAYAPKKNMNYPLLLWDDKFDDAYGPIVGVPITFFIGRDGTISRRHFGPVTKERIDQEIKALL